MLRVTPLASGSKGNAVLVRSATTSLLIDCGLAVGDLMKRLGAASQTLQALDGLLITHEHTDHIRSLREMSEGYRLPVYLHERLYAHLKGKMRLPSALPFLGESFRVGEIEVFPFPTSHDAVRPVGFAFSDSESSFLYATDLGYVTQNVVELGKKADVVFLESNHDLTMLETGSYPAFLKARIASARGHLSNASCATTLIELAKEGKKTFILGHLSEENNLPELAYWESAKRLEEAGMKAGRDYGLLVAAQHDVSKEVECKHEFLDE